MSNLRKALIASAIGIILSLLVSGIFRMELPNRISGPCLVAAQAEWSLFQPQPDVLMARKCCASPPQLENVAIMQFERTDFVTFNAALSLNVGTAIRKDELLGSIESTENTVRFQELCGELAVARANLVSISTGEKGALREKSAGEFQYAREQLAVNEKTWRRKQELFERDLLSREEIELAEAQKKLLELNVSIAEAELSSVRTGQKREQAEVIEQQIEALEASLGTLRLKLAKMTILAPFDAFVMEPAGEDTILTLCKLDTMVVQIPVEQSKRKYLSEGAPVTINVPSASIYALKASISSIDRSPVFINGRTMYLARCLLCNDGCALLPGMTGRARIECPAVGVVQRFDCWLESLKYTLAI